MTALAADAVQPGSRPPSPVPQPLNVTVANADDSYQPSQAAISAGRKYKYIGAGTIATGVVLLAISILIVCTLTTSLGRKFNDMGPGGAKMLNYMGQHASGFLAGGLAGCAVSLITFGVGGFLIYKGKRDQEVALVEDELRFSKRSRTT